MPRSSSRSSTAAGWRRRRASRRSFASLTCLRTDRKMRTNSREPRDVEAASFRRLMRALASLGLCTEHDDGSFELRPMGSLLRAEAPDSLRSWTIWWSRHLWPAWGNLLHRVKTGENNRSLRTGTADFGYLGCDAEAAVVFNRAMAEITRLVSREIVRAYDFSRMDRIVDVGGGYGELLAVILGAYPQMHGTLFDLPHAIKGAGEQLEKARVIRALRTRGRQLLRVGAGRRRCLPPQEHPPQLERRAERRHSASLPPSDAEALKTPGGRADHAGADGAVA